MYSGTDINRLLTNTAINVELHAGKGAFFWLSFSKPREGIPPWERPWLLRDGGAVTGIDQSQWIHTAVVVAAAPSLTSIALNILSLQLSTHPKATIINSHHRMCNTNANATIQYLHELFTK
ncbi:hypothetical protein CBL_13709 [Carabus blaptoides fortunei]